jgi:lipopolysaccharide biosynthesis glycosyltransferase
MNVLYSSSPSYFDCFLTSAYSLCLTSKDDSEPIHLFLFSCGLLDSQVAKAIKLFRCFENVTFECIDVLEKLNQAGAKMGLPSVRGSFATYFRLFAADILESCDKVICIDSDTLVLSSLSSLWDFDLKGNAIGACPEVSVYLKNSSYEDDFVLSKCVPYFNIGVCVIDFSVWRSQRLGSLVASYFSSKNCQSFRNDQSVVNYLLHEHMIKIPLKYNFSTPLHRMGYRQYLRFFKGAFVYDENEFIEAQKSPAIVHFYGQPLDRPWFKRSSAIFQKEYRKRWKELNNGPFICWPRNQSGFVFATHDKLLYLAKKYLPFHFYLWFRFRFSQSVRKKTGRARNST